MTKHSKTQADMQVAVMRACGDPLAALKLEQLYSALIAVRRMLSQATDPKKTKALQNRLLQDFSDTELNAICSTPDFIKALIGLLACSLLRLPGSLLDDEEWTGVAKREQQQRREARG